SLGQPNLGILELMEHEGDARVPRLPVLQSMGLQKRQHVPEPADRFPRGRTVPLDEPLLGHVGLLHGFGFCVYLWYRTYKERFAFAASAGSPPIRRLLAIAVICVSSAFPGTPPTRSRSACAPIDGSYLSAARRAPRNSR